MVRLKNEILEMIHNKKCPRGFWFRENINEQKEYILELVKTELNIKTPAAYVCLFHINDILRINSSIQARFGLTQTYEFLEEIFGIPRFLLAYNKNIPKGRKCEYNDFIHRITVLSGIKFMPYDKALCTEKVTYKWYNKFDKASATIVANMYRNRKAYNTFIDYIFYDYLTDKEVEIING